MPGKNKERGLISEVSLKGCFKGPFSFKLLTAEFGVYTMVIFFFFFPSSQKWVNTCFRDEGPWKLGKSPSSIVFFQVIRMFVIVGNEWRTRNYN